MVCRSMTSSLLFSHVDVFSQGIWPQLQEIRDPALKGLADSLPGVVLQRWTINLSSHLLPQL